MGRGSSKSSSSGGGNGKYKGFTITDSTGETRNYVVTNGKVEYADGSNQTGILGVGNEINVIQQAYDMEGSVNKVIQRINRIGVGKAKTLSDKAVEKLRKDREKERQEADKQKNKDQYRRKGGVNRHRAYWSAM